MSEYISEPRLIGKVRLITDGGHRLYLTLPDGFVSMFVSNDVYNYDIGAVVLYDQSGDIEEVAPELWQEPPWIGIVKHHDDTGSVVERDPTLFHVTKSEVGNLAIGNTVEVVTEKGVTRLLSKTPIQSRETFDAEATSADLYRSKPAEKKLSFDDFGGLPEVKQRAKELIETPLENHALLSDIGARPIKGVLFTGNLGPVKRCSLVSPPVKRTPRSTKSMGHRFSTSGTARASA
jgi:transitional endoplasmic reticulum ATPase